VLVFDSLLCGVFDICGFVTFSASLVFLVVPVGTHIFVRIGWLVRVLISFGCALGFDLSNVGFDVGAALWFRSGRGCMCCTRLCGGMCTGFRCWFRCRL